MRYLSLIPMLLAGCAADPPGLTFTAGPNSYLALGDSYTVGTSVAESDRWPAQLTRALRNEGVTLDGPKILAEAGWRTEDLQEALDHAKITGPFRLVSLQIGVNDQYKKGTPEEYRPRFVRLLEQAIALAGGRADHVLVLSIPDYDYGPTRKFAPANIGETIDRFNVVNREEAERRGATYVDVTPLSRRAAAEPDLRATDLLHFSGEMYRLWTDVITPRLTKVLKQHQ